MTEIIEQNEENINVLEGDVILAGKGEKLFKNIQALADFVNVFNITNYQIRDGWTIDGKYVVQLQYQKASH